MAPHNHICFFCACVLRFPKVAQAGKERAAYFFTQWQRWDLPREEVWFCDWIPRLNHSHSPDRAGFINETETCEWSTVSDHVPEICARIRDAWPSHPSFKIRLKKCSEIDDLQKARNQAKWS